MSEPGVPPRPPKKKTLPAVLPPPKTEPEEASDPHKNDAEGFDWDGQPKSGDADCCDAPPKTDAVTAVDWVGPPKTEPVEAVS